MVTMGEVTMLFNNFSSRRDSVMGKLHRLFPMYVSHFLHVSFCPRKKTLIWISLMELISQGSIISCPQTPFKSFNRVILTRKTWARCWNWGHLRGARAAGDTAVRSLHWSHPCSQCPWSSHSNLSHPSLASAPQDTARKERGREREGRWWERDEARGWGGRHKLGRGKKRSQAQRSACAF